MKNGDWAERIQHLQQRVEQLRHSVRRPLTLSDALDEVAATLEELSVAHEELYQQNEELLESRHALEAEQQRYQELFEFAPDGYLVTDAQGTIREANRVATVLLNVPPSRLSGKPLALYVPNTERKAFRTQLNRLLAGETRGEWGMPLQPVRGEPVPVAVTVAATRDPQGNVVALRWLLRDITQRQRAEVALRESEARYRALFDNANDAIATFTLDGVTTNVNRAAARMLGWSREEMVGQHFSTFGAPTSVALAEERTRRFLAGEKPPSATFEAELVRKDGSLLQVEARTRALRDGDNKVVGFQGIYRDITERKQLMHELRTLNAKLERRVQERTAELVRANEALQIEIAQHQQAEEALRERETLLNAILQTTQAVVYVLDTDGRYVHVNRQFEEVVQMQNVAVRGKSVSELFPPAVAAALDVNTRAVLASGTPLETEVIVPHPDGQLHVYHSLKAPLLDATGALRGIVGVATDITGRKHLEGVIRQREREFVTLVENLPDIVFRLDRKLRYLFINRAVEQVSGLPPEHFVDKTGRELGIPVEACDVFEPACRTVFDTGQPQVVEFAVRNQVFRSRLIPEGAPNDAVETLLGITEDITEQKAIEDALRQSEERYRWLAQEREQQLIVSDRRISFGELAASLAHEFNNPLGIVLGFTQDVLKDVSPENSLYRRLQIIEMETQRCKRLMERLRDFARPAPIQLGWIDPAVVIRTSLELVATQCRHLRVSTTLDLSPNLPPLYADQQQLQQVLLNLFFNALDAMPRGGTLTVQDRIALRSAETNGESESGVVVTVTDTGPGIAADHLRQIFRPFFTTKTKEGMGLGLSICESIMTAHGGRITVDSRVGQGTTFSLFFPVTG